MRPPLDHMRIRGDSRQHLYGWVRDNGKTFHGGWDLEAQPLTPVYAVAAGTIINLDFHPPTHKERGNYGRNVTLQLDELWNDTQLFAFYAHLSHVNVTAGPVRAGQQIGLTGITGFPFKEHKTVAPHLHFEFRTRGEWIDGKDSKSRVNPERVWPHFRRPSLP